MPKPLPRHRRPRTLRHRRRHQHIPVTIHLKLHRRRPNCFRKTYRRHRLPLLHLHLFHRRPRRLRPPPPSAPPPPPPSSEPVIRPSRPSHPPAKLSHPPAKRQNSPSRPANGLPGRPETEEERTARKKREYEKQKQEERRHQMLKQSQASVLQKTQMISAAAPKAPHGPAAAVSHAHAERRMNPLLTGDRLENRLKKPTTFICKLKFRNELPDPTAQPKLLSMSKDKDRYTKYTITSLEKMHKPKLYTEPDLGLPLDLLDLRIYNPPDVHMVLDPEDEELLRDDEVTTPIKQDGIRKKERPTDKGVSWLVKTQYISPLSADAAKLSLSEKQVKEMRQTREGTNLLLEDLNSREKQIQAIEESFRAAKLRPVHQTKPGMEPARVLPLLPDFDRSNDRFVVANFDGDPTADAEIYNKLDRSIRDDLESQALMKSFSVRGSDPSRPEKFLSYMVPAPEELSKDIYDESEDVRYSWLREYHWEARGDVGDDPTTYLVTFGAENARYLSLPLTLNLQKKKAKEGRSGEDVEHYPVPSWVTVRRTEDAAVAELKESGGSSSNHGRMNKRAKLPGVHSPSPRKRHVMNGHYNDEEDMSD